MRTLRHSSLFSLLSRQIRWRIASLATSRFFEKGEWLCHQGDEGDYCYIIESGTVEIIHELSEGRELSVATVGAGEVLGELSLIDGLPRSAGMRALKPVQTFAISSMDFRVLLQSYPEIALQLLPVVAQRLRRTQDRLMQQGGT